MDDPGESKLFRRIQDWGMLTVTIGSIIGWGLTYFRDHLQMADKLEEVVNAQEDFNKKYIPLIENSDKAIAVIRDQLEDMNDKQDRIERKVDAVYSFRN